MKRTSSYLFLFMTFHTCIFTTHLMASLGTDEEKIEVPRIVPGEATPAGWKNENAERQIIPSPRGYNTEDEFKLRMVRLRQYRTDKVQLIADYGAVGATGTWDLHNFPSLTKTLEYDISQCNISNPNQSVAENEYGYKFKSVECSDPKSCIIVCRKAKN